MKFIPIAILAICLISSYPIKAGDQVIKQIAKGESIKTAVLTVEDQEFGQGSGFKTLNHKVRISLLQKYAEEHFSSTEWTLSVDFSADLKFPNGLLKTETGTLEISGDAMGNVISSNIDELVFQGASYVSLSVTSHDFHDSQGSLSVIPDEFYLSAEVIVERYYDFNPSTVPVINTSEYDPSTNELVLAWDFVEGAEEYELEYLFVDDGEITGNHQSLGIVYDFKNASRLNLAGNTFSISMVYPKGSMIYRVRGIGYDLDYVDFKKHRLFSAWSYDPVPMDMNIAEAVTDDATSECYYYSPGINPDKNWTYTATYAEGGKKKEVASYADGSGRTRQQVTLSNTEQNVIIGETKYDFVGRAAVNILPGVGQSEGLKFYGDSAAPVNGHWDKDNFATDNHINDNNDTLPEPLPIGGIASKYYSANNDLEFINKQALPKSNGYPYSMTQFKNDGTDRPILQTGIGDEFRYKANGGHVTKYFYSMPTQSEIDRLFGSEAGHARFYKKNLVVDPNGQQSVIYMDGRGQTIATALGGDNPDNLDPIGDKKSEIIGSPLFGGPGDLPSNGKLVETSQFVCSVPQTLQLNYDLDTNLYPLCDLNGKVLRYNIGVEVRNHKGQLVTDTLFTDVQSLTSSALVEWDAKIGNYSITRTVELNAVSKENFISALDSNLEASKFNAPTGCMPSYIISGDTICEPLNCDSACLLSFTFYQDNVLYYQDAAGNIYAPSPSNPAVYVLETDANQYWPVNSSEAPFNVAIAECIEDCEGFQDSTGSSDLLNFFADDRCSMKLSSMLLDVQPGGTYMNYQCDSVYCFNLNEPSLTGILDSVVLDGYLNPAYYYNVPVESGIFCLEINPGNRETAEAYYGEMIYAFDLPIFTHTYHCDSTQILNEEGVDFVNVSTELGGGIDASSWQDVFINWQPGYENTLIKYHPEICAYNFFCHYKEFCDGADTLYMHDVNLFQGQMYGTSVYAEALNYSIEGRPHNLMNPLGLVNSSSAGYLQDNQSYINEGTVLATDPIIGCNPGDTTTLSGYAFKHLKELLRSFVTVKTSAGVSVGEYSLWYLLDDPDGIADANGGNNTNLDTNIIRLFNMFHGDGSCNVGIITDDNTKLLYFQSIYLFLREKVIYDYFRKIYVCPSTESQYTYWNGDSDYDGMLDGTNVTLNYPRNPLYEFYDDPTNTSIFNHLNADIDSVETNISYPEIDSCTCRHFVDYLDSIGYATASNQAIASHLNSLYCANLTATDVGNILQCDLESSPNFQYVFTLPTSLKCGPSDFYLGKATEDCSANLARLAKEYADVEWQKNKTAFLDSIGGFYDHYAFSQFKDYESVEVTYDLGEYHYTLYYYDLAGNLVKTIPPAGVQPLTAVQIDDVQDYRQDTTTASYLRPVHTYITNYSYNTQNQVKVQNTPDGGRVEFWYDNNARIIASQNAVQTNKYSYTLYDALGRIVESGQVTGSGLEDTVAADPVQFYDLLTSGSRDQVVFTLYDQPLYNIAGTGASEMAIAEAFDEGQTFLRNRVASVFYIPSIPDSNYYIYNNHIDPSLPSAYLNYESATHYSYDAHGNVKTLVQEFPGLESKERRFFRMDYDYDLVSGNVKMVSYQAEKADQFHHRYLYDANNRITSVETSMDGNIWEEDARYFYYPHGPLSRMELGDMSVQGLDYAYTLQGWLKTVNGSSLGEDRNVGIHDLGSDGAVGNNLNKVFAADAFAFSLDYYEGDYDPLGSASFLAEISGGSNPLQSGHRSLYNGNISRMITAFNDNVEDPVAVSANNYVYDQLNRITGFETHTEDLLNQDNKSMGASSGGYKGSYFYDPNGNIDNLSRWNGSGVLMDKLSYSYDNSGINKPKRNRLTHVDDLVLDGVEVADLDDQGPNNYNYDDLGNMVSDQKKGIEEIKWNLQGKISTVQKGTNLILTFGYDALGNRISKTDHNSNKTTYYVRDAQGNVMATYEESGSDLNLIQLMLYGSDRLGTLDTVVTIGPEFTGINTSYEVPVLPAWKRHILTDNQNLSSLTMTGNNSPYVLTIEAITEDLLLPITSVTPLAGQYSISGSGYLVPQGGSFTFEYATTTLYLAPQTTFAITSSESFGLNYYEGNIKTEDYHHSRILGNKNYELKNHLGNVLSTVSDVKIWKNISSYTYDYDTLMTSETGQTISTLENIEWSTVGSGSVSIEDVVTVSSEPEDRLEMGFERADGDTCDYMLCVNFSTEDWDGGPLDILLMDETNEDILRKFKVSTPGQYCFELGLDSLSGDFFHVVFTNSDFVYYQIIDFEIFKICDWTSSGEGIRLSGGGTSQPGLEVDAAQGAYIEFPWVLPVNDSCGGQVCVNLDLVSGLRPEVRLLDTSQSVIATLYLEDSLCQNITFVTGKSMDELAYVRLYSAEQGSYVLYNLKVVEACTTTVTDDYLVADVIGAQDYYPFGSTMPGRVFNSTDYDYGFNGKLKDDEIKGSGNSYDFGARIYDPRLGRWLSTDPKEKKYPGLSPYQFAANIPLLIIDNAGEDFRFKVNKETHSITIETTIHVYGPDATQGIVDEMNNDFATLNTQGVYYDENGIEYKVTVNANYVLNESLNQASDNLNLPKDDYANTESFNEEQLSNLGIAAGDNIYKVDNNHPKLVAGYMGLTSGSGTVAIGGVSNHESGHYLGLSDRYMYGGMAVESGFEDDIMGNGSISEMHKVHLINLAEFALENMESPFMPKEGDWNVVHHYRTDNVKGNIAERKDATENTMQEQEERKKATKDEE